MYAVLEIASGSQQGKCLQVRPGQTLTVGRQGQANLVIRDDAMMSNTHFTLTCDGQDCRLLDSQSRFGTMLNQARVTEAVMQDGDRIVAGSTTFVVRIVAEATARQTVRPPESGTALEATAASEMTAVKTVKEAVPEAGTTHDRVLRVLRQQPQPLYALVDAARDLQVLAQLANSREEYQTLYEGPQGEAMADFGPFLVRFSRESPLLESLVREGWGKSWGVYLTCAKEFKEVRKHFRHFLTVKNPDEKAVYFRFYDPRVLRVFLPVCTTEETVQFFGPVASFLAEDRNPAKLLQFTSARQGVKADTVLLTPP